MGSVVKVSGAFVAFLLGSAFASGQESIQFYAAYGLWGLGGVAITLLLFAYVAFSLLRAGRVHALTTNEETFKHYCGNVLGKLMAWYAIAFIACVYWVMIVGAGAALDQAYGLPEWLGRIFMAAISVATILLGLRRIVDVIGAVGPVLVLLTLIISLIALVQNGDQIGANLNVIGELDLLKASPNWALSGVLYVGFSLMGLASFLPAIGERLSNQKQTLSAALLGPTLLMGTMLFVTLALLSQMEQVASVAMPTMTLAQGITSELALVFGVFITLGIYTTASPMLWVVCVRFTQEHATSYKVLAMILALVGVLGGSIVPFGQLVNLIYPTVGYAGAVLVICMVTKDLREWRAVRQDK
ncbi:MAG: hypothetical protein AAF541_17860 [Pseudomonadota bacterium]